MSEVTINVAVTDGGTIDADLSGATSVQVTVEQAGVIESSVIAGGKGVDGRVLSVVAGTGVAVDESDPTNPSVGVTNDVFRKSVDDTDDVTVGATNKFATAAEKTKLGFIAVSQAVDLDTIESDLAGHIANVSNPHTVTKTQVGLANVDNTSDANKPVSTAQQTALDAKVAGPASVTDDLPAVFDGTGGKTIKQKTYAAFKTLLALVKGDVGLGNVDNTSDVDKPVSTAQQTALDAKLNNSQKGAANGLAELDGNSLVPAAQLPSYVDDVITVADFASLPITGEDGKIYITVDTNLTYRWNGTGYTEISASLALGETSSTAYRGDRGKTAFDHSQLVAGNPHAVTKAEVGLGNADNTSDASKPVSIAQQTALDAKVDENAGITGATKTKITYDAKGLVTAGADATQDDIGDGTTNKQYSATEKTKLAGIETGADVTDATNVDAAGATMNADTSLAGNGYFLDEDDMVSNSASKVASQQSIKNHVAAEIAAAGGGDVVGPASATDDNPVVFDGTSGKVIKEKTYSAFKTLLALVKGDVGLGSVDNTSDADKPVSTAQKAYIDPHEEEGSQFKLHNPYLNAGANPYQGQLHTHSYPNSADVSDTTNTPTKVGEAYEAAGYDFYAITDHGNITSDPAVAGITWLGDSVEAYPVNVHTHILAHNTTVDDDASPTQIAIDAHRAAGALATVAHPDLGDVGTSRQELMTLENYNAIEIWNPYKGNINMEETWDYLLSRGKRVWGIAVDDNHNVTSGEPFDVGWVVAYADSNTASNLLNALEHGQFYASTGADVGISVLGKVITATASVASKIEFIGKYGEVLQTATASTSSAYTVTGREMYVRVRVTKDSDSTLAWSQPIYIEKQDTSDITRLTSMPSESLYRNALTNGNFNVWQRGTSFSTSTDYTADRWWMFLSSATGTVTQQDEPDEFGQYALRMTLSTRTAPYDMSILQPLESRDSIAFRNKTVCFSFWVRRNSTFNNGGLRLHIYAGEGTDENSASTNRTTFTKDYTYDKIREKNETGGQFKKGWTQVYVTGFMEADKTQLCCTIKLIDANVPAGSWVEIKGAQLHVGNRPLDFQPRSYGDELRRCQRYYQRVYGAQRSVGSSVSTSTSVQIWQPLPVPLRVGAAGAIGGTRGTHWFLQSSSGGNNTSGSVASSSTGTDWGVVRFDSGTFTAGSIYHILLGSATASYIEWNAEL